MNRVFIEERAGTRNTITDKEDIKHLTKSLRVEVGEEIEVVDKEEKESIMQIVSIGNGEIVLQKIQDIDIEREAKIEIVLYQGIPKGSKMDLICQKLTEIGACKIVPVKFSRCVATDISANKKDRLEKIMKEAAMQAKRTRIPELTKSLTFTEMLESLDENTCNITLYEEERQQTIKDFLKKTNPSGIKKMGIVIGPEGGMEETEVEALKKKGSPVLTLGNRILRTETAGLVASSLVLYEWEM